MLLLTLALVSAPTVALSTTTVAPAEGSLYAIRAKTIHVGGGQVIEDGTIVVENGKIRAVGKNVSVPQGASTIEHDGAVSAGLIALHGYAGTKLGGSGQGFRFNVFGSAELKESWKMHVHGHVHIEDPNEEIILDRGEQLVVDESDDDEHGEEGHDEHGDDHGDDHGDEHGDDDEHEHGTGDPEPVELEVPAPVIDPTQFAAREVVVDTTRTVLPEAETVHAFNPHSADFRQALEAGITTLVLTPDAKSLVPGQTAVVKTSGRVIERNGHLSLGFRSRALQPNRYPTSFSGAVAELDQRFEKPEGAFERAAKGELPVLFECANRNDVLRAADFAKKHKLKGAVSGATRSGEVAAAIKGANLAAVVGPFPIGSSGRSLRSVVDLAAAGVPFGFALDAPRYDPTGLRVSAASCVGQGLDRNVAMSALTDTAAQIAGVERAVGKLATGLDADLVLWSGDPLDLASRPEMVIVDGEMLVGGAQ